ncbi:MAG TPA: CesT family type III secretion system chaperone [Albitalea sp.]|uniref:CesT family type III secretion system chaperone n=1 Tax=Piscinibacter sp. TaxID=1903157 RepID=UPI002ED1684F
MNRGLFEQLVKDFCTLCNMEEPERILQGGPIAVDDIVFSLIYSETVNPDLIFIYGDFGDLPTGKEQAALRALLEANLYLYTGNGPVFAMSTDTGRVVSAQHQRLVDIKAADLRSALVKLADQAKLWRQHHFLGDSRKPGGPNPLAAPAASAAAAAPRAAPTATRSPFATR